MTSNFDLDSGFGVIIKWAVILTILTAAMALISANVQSADVLLWNASFDTDVTGNNPNGWQSLDGSNIIIIENPSASNKSIYCNGTADDTVNQTLGSLAVTTGKMMKWIINFNVTGTDNMFFWIPLTEGSSKHIEISTGGLDQLQWIDDAAAAHNQTPFSQNVWNELEVVVSDTRFNASLNGVLFAECLANCETNRAPGTLYGTNDISIRMHGEPGIRQYISDVALYNITLDTADTTAPVITFEYPHNTARNNTWNGTIIFNTDENANITVNATEYTQLSSNGTHFVYNYTDPLATHVHHINFTAQDAAINNATYFFNFTYDITLPVITHNTGSIATDNSTIYNGNTAHINVTMTDTYLFATVINITNSSLHEVQSNTTTGIFGNSWTMDEDIDISAQHDGIFKVRMIAADDNTDLKIEPYDTSKLDVDKRLVYHTDEGLMLSVESQTKTLTDFYTTKQKDRYTFTFDYAEKGSTVTYDVRSSSPLYYHDLRGYPQFASWNGESGNWLDFNLDSLKSYSVNKLSDYWYEVTIESAEKTLEFNSIGGLNIVTEDYEFTVDTTPPSYNQFTNNSLGGFSINMTDNSALASYIFSWNDTGAYVNDSSVVISGTDQLITTTKTTTADEDTVICGRYYIYDTAANLNQTTDQCFAAPAPSSRVLPSLLGIVIILIAAFTIAYFVRDMKGLGGK